MLSRDKRSTMLVEYGAARRALHRQTFRGMIGSICRIALRSIPEGSRGVEGRSGQGPIGQTNGLI